jgi:hypothetical protein
MKIAFPLLAAMWLLAPPVTAQGAAPVTPSPPDTAAVRHLRLLLDSPDTMVDEDFLKRELAWVDWVRDRADADVYVLLTLRSTGSGGSEGTFYVMRPNGGGPANDTLRVFAPPAASDDAVRRLIARTLAAALARDLVGRPEGEYLKLSVEAPARTAPQAAARDPWNQWVYKISTNGSMNGESSYRNFYMNNALTASRVTEKHKLGASVSQNLSENRYVFDDGSRLVTVTRSLSARIAGTRSVGPRWSWGGSSSVYSSSYSNVASSVRVGPAIEYDVFPYSESSRHSLTLAYQLNVSHSRYEEVTLFGKTSEVLFMNEFDAGFAARQPWGSVDLSASLNQYLHDSTKYRLSSSISASLKLWRGFSLDTYLWGARIHDQLALRRGNQSATDVITRQRQLATSFSYYLNFGLSYRFGSIYNNVVNQRLNNTLGSF